MPVKGSFGGVAISICPPRFISKFECSLLAISGRDKPARLSLHLLLTYRKKPNKGKDTHIGILYI